MDRILDRLVSIYYPIFYISCSFLQLLLFFLIFTKTPKILRNMRWFLYPSNFSNLILASAAFFIQVRNVNNTHSLALLCQGPCKSLGAWYCVNGYIIMLVSALVGGVLNLHTLYYRTITIRFFENSKVQTLIFCVWYIIPVLAFIFYHIEPTNFEFVYLETLQNYPNYDFERYKNFGGFANSHSIYATLNLLMIVVFALNAPAFGYFWRRKAAKILDKSYRSLSANTIMQFKSLIHCLGLQIMLPLFCYAPVAVFFIYNKYSGDHILFSEYALAIMITLPAALDAILQISFIVPYRNTVKSMFFCEIKNSRVSSTETKMSKFNEEDSGTEQEEEKDEQTAKFLHKLAKNGKERGIPESVTAFYEKKAWEALKSDEKFKSCEKCYMPPPPPGDFAEQIAPSEKCRNCGEINKKPIGKVSEIVKNEEIVKKNEQKPMKRPASRQEPMVEKKTMPRKTAPAVTKGVVTPYLSPKAKKSKKSKILEQKEPDFLAKLFGIGANPV